MPRPIKDLSPLRGLKLQRLNMNTSSSMRDLSPLKGMPIEFLTMRGPATNLNVLAGMPLRSVSLGHPDLVMDLSFLAGKELRSLFLSGRVTAFAPLKKVTFSAPTKTDCVQLMFCRFDWVKVPDAARLPEYIPALENLSIPSPGKAEVEIVQRFPNLKKVRVVPLPGQDTPLVTMTFDKFKKKFGPKEKEDPQSARPKPK